MDEIHYIAGDICPTAETQAAFCAGDVCALFGQELLGLLANSAGLAFNLEAALTDDPSLITKSGSCLTAPEDSVKALNEALQTYLRERLDG